MENAALALKAPASILGSSSGVGGEKERVQGR